MKITFLKCEENGKQAKLFPKYSLERVKLYFKVVESYFLSEICISDNPQNLI
jgi:hypothetical protein